MAVHRYRVCLRKSHTDIHFCAHMSYVHKCTSVTMRVFTQGRHIHIYSKHIAIYYYYTLCWVPWLPTQCTRFIWEDLGGGDNGRGSPASTPDEIICSKPSPFHSRSCRVTPMSYPIGKVFSARLCLASLIWRAQNIRCHSIYLSIYLLIL